MTILASLLVKVLFVSTTLITDLLGVCQACSFIVCNFDATTVASSVLSSPGNNSNDGKSMLKQANYYSKFRGPDATNVEVVRGWTFLHNLLSMTGNVTLQPFISDDGGKVVAVFNGEVYNYRDLAKELADDKEEEAFYHSSDGLVLLPAYQKWGPRFVEHLQGEFAIVLVDFDKNLILLSTDVFSTKPLWYGMWPCEEQQKDGSSFAKDSGKYKKTCFAAASYESSLKGLGVPDRYRKMADANQVLVLSMKNSSSFVETSPRRPVFKFDLNQHKTSTEDWEKAFVEAVRLRTDERINTHHNRVFVGLSSGYDSGAVALALELLERPFLAYHLATKKDNYAIVKQRFHYCNKHLSNATVIRLDSTTIHRERKWLEERCERFQYKYHGAPRNFYVTDDNASLGLSTILTSVRKQHDGGLIYLSGSGSDETISDYGMNGIRLKRHSCFGGLFPANLSTIFPWCSFYTGTQRSFLMKEELTGGAHGIETRYPFLDPLVVQEYLWLTAETKNSEYKRPVADFLRRYAFPNMYGTKAGFGWKEHKNRSEEHDVVANKPLLLRTTVTLSSHQPDGVGKSSKVHADENEVQTLKLVAGLNGAMIILMTDTVVAFCLLVLVCKPRNRRRVKSAFFATIMLFSWLIFFTYGWLRKRT